LGQDTMLQCHLPHDKWLHAVLTSPPE